MAIECPLGLPACASACLWQENPAIRQILIASRQDFQREDVLLGRGIHLQRPIPFPEFGPRHDYFIIDEQLCQIIKPVWRECVLACNGLDPVSQFLASPLEVFAFFHPQYVNTIRAPFASSTL